MTEINLAKYFILLADMGEVCSWGGGSIPACTEADPPLKISNDIITSPFFAGVIMVQKENACTVYLLRYVWQMTLLSNCLLIL